MHFSVNVRFIMQIGNLHLTTAKKYNYRNTIINIYIYIYIYIYISGGHRLFFLI